MPSVEQPARTTPARRRRVPRQGKRLLIGCLATNYICHCERSEAIPGAEYILALVASAWPARTATRADNPRLPCRPFSSDQRRGPAAERGAPSTGFGFIGNRPSRCARLRASLRARRMASAFSRAFFSEGFSEWPRSFILRKFHSRCIFFFSALRAWSTLLWRTRTCTRNPLRLLCSLESDRLNLATRSGC